MTLLMVLWSCSAAPVATPAPHAHVEHDDHDDHATVEHRFDDAEKWAGIFDDPARDAWQKPAQVVGFMNLTEGATVADIGAGTGYFNPHLARAVGARGKVIAVDIEPTLVAHMTSRAKADATPQVEARLGTPGDPALAPDEVAGILIVDTYHHISDRRDYFVRLSNAVKPGGVLLVVDFKKGDIPVGPPEQHRIAEDKVVAEMTAAGWTLLERHDLPYQFALAFEVSGP